MTATIRLVPQYILAVALLVFTGYPFLYMVATSFKTQEQFFLWIRSRCSRRFNSPTISWRLKMDLWRISSTASSLHRYRLRLPYSSQLGELSAEQIEIPLE